MDKNKYPIFGGRVLAVPAIVEEFGEYLTCVQYLEPQNQIKGEEMIKTLPLGFLSLFSEEHRDKLNKTLQQIIKNALIPMRIDPSVILGAEIRTRFGELNTGEYGEGSLAKTYELEVIKGRSQAGGDIFTGLAERIDGAPHTGIRYIKILKPE